jgi:hypothetical protein
MSGELIPVDFSRDPVKIKTAVDKIYLEHVLLQNSKNPRVWQNAQEEKKEAVSAINRRETIEVRRLAAIAIQRHQFNRYQGMEE